MVRGSCSLKRSARRCRQTQSNNRPRGGRAHRVTLVLFEPFSFFAYFILWLTIGAA